MTKKQDKIISEDIRTIFNIFKSMKFKRYQEFDYTKKNYFKKIKFTFPDKVKWNFYLKKKDYIIWRGYLKELTKTMKTIKK